MYNIYALGHRKLCSQKALLALAHIRYVRTDCIPRAVLQFDWSAMLAAPDHPFLPRVREIGGLRQTTLSARYYSTMMKFTTTVRALVFFFLLILLPPISGQNTCTECKRSHSGSLLIAKGHTLFLGIVYSYDIIARANIRWIPFYCSGSNSDISL